jgi:hypothetical protein
VKYVTVALSLVVGAAVGWAARDAQRIGVLDGTAEIVVQHPQQNPFGVGTARTRIRVYGVGDDDFAPMPSGASNADLWVVTINGTNYRGVAQDRHAP